MLIIKIIGITILTLNIAGIGFILFMVGVMLKNYFSAKKKIIAVKDSPQKKQKKPLISNDNIIDKEDDLLKNMDLSDLDSLNLDDFDR